MLRKLFFAAAFALLGLSQASAQVSFRADSQITVSSYISVNNTTAVLIKPTSGVVYSIDGFNNSTTLAYVKLYNSASATCGSGTPAARYLIPYGTSSAGGGFNISNINGDVYPAGISMCITTGIADSDTGAPAANAYIVNIHWK